MVGELEDSLPEEKELSLVVGQIIRRWARFEHCLQSSIMALRMTMRSRHRKARQLPGCIIPPPIEDFSVHPDLKVKIRMKHLRQLILVLTADNKILSKLDHLFNTARGISVLRDELAHSEIRIDYPSNKDVVVLHNLKWLYDKTPVKTRIGSADLSYDQRRGDWVRSGHGGFKEYRMQELANAAEQLTTLWWELRDIISHVPYEGPAVANFPSPKS